MRYLTLEEVLALQQRVIAQSGGAPGVRDVNLVDSAVAQPSMTFDGRDLFPTLTEKAAALGYSLIMNHAFVDGNKRIGHAAMETFLALNGHEIACGVDEQERMILDVAAGIIRREQFAEWLSRHVHEKAS
jgi:death on curing protein